MGRESLDNQTLLTAAKAGDQSAFDQLLVRYRSQLVRWCANAIGRTLRRRTDASDVVQLSLTDLCRDLCTFRGTTIQEFEAWLRTVVKTTLAGVARHEKAAKRNVLLDRPVGSASDFVPIDDHSSPSSHATRREEAQRAIAGLERLPARQSEAIRLRYLEQLTLKEIAERMKCKTVRAAAALLQNGLKNLRAIEIVDEQNNE